MISIGWMMIIAGIVGVSITLLLQVVLIRVFARQKKRVIEDKEEA